jgi:hypothetical protein
MDKVLQEIHDKVIARFTDGKGQSLSSTSGACVYETPDGYNHCAAGVLLDRATLDCIHDDDLNELAWGDLADYELVPERFIPYTGLIEDLQRVHDYPSNWGVDGKIMDSKLEEVENIFKCWEEA